MSISDIYAFMHIIHHQYTMLKGFITGGVLILIVFAMGFFFSEATLANDRSLVSVYMNGQELTFTTDLGTTVGEVLERAEITVYDYDLVEPSLNTPITADSFNVNIFRARPVMVVDDAQRYQIMTPHQSPYQMAVAAGLDVHEEDHFELERINDFVADGTVGLKLVITRATPITINLYGNELVTRTHLDTVGEALAEKGIVLNESDLIVPAADVPIAEDMKVHIVHVGTDTATQEVAVPFEEEEIRDTAQPVGYRDVREVGEDGMRLVTYELVLHNGQEVGRNEIQSVVTREPKKQVVVVGVRPLAGRIYGDKAAILSQAGIAETDHVYADQIILRESGWNAGASNPSSGAYGLCQALPGSKMSSAGADWQSNAVTQLRWCNGYAVARYGSWAGAYDFWLTHHWW